MEEKDGKIEVYAVREDGKEIFPVIQSVPGSMRPRRKRSRFSLTSIRIRISCSGATLPAVERRPVMPKTTTAICPS
jgi:hypothetical protein